MLLAKKPNKDELFPANIDRTSFDKIPISILDTNIYYDGNETKENLIVKGKALKGNIYFETECENIPILKLMIEGYAPEYWKRNLESLDIEYIKKDILPRYDNFDPAHRKDHANAVINDSLKLATELGINPTLSYVIAAFHDVGLVNGRENHNITSAKIVYQDKWINKNFSSEEIKLMAEAVEDHRASSNRFPRSIFGIVVADADRQIDIDTVIERTIKYGIDHSPGDREHIFEQVMQHMQKKYSKAGYIELFLREKEKNQKLEKLRILIENPKELRVKFNQLYDNISKELDF